MNIEVDRVGSPTQIGASARYRIMLTTPPPGWMQEFLKIAVADQAISDLEMEVERRTILFTSEKDRLKTDVYRIDQYIKQTNARRTEKP